jgi:hypothetical protein
VTPKRLAELRRMTAMAIEGTWPAEEGAELVAEVTRLQELLDELEDLWKVGAGVLRRACKCGASMEASGDTVGVLWVLGIFSRQHTGPGHEITSPTAAARIRARQEAEEVRKER